MSEKKTPTKLSDRTIRLLGTIGAVVLAVVVGCGVYLYASIVHANEVDAKVQEKFAQEKAKQPPQTGPPPTMVQVSLVQKRTLQRRVELVGRLREIKRAPVPSEVEGKLLALLTPGGRQLLGPHAELERFLDVFMVDQDIVPTVIARVDPTWAKLALAKAEGDLQAAKANAKRSASELELVEAMFNRGSAERQSLIDAQSEKDADAASIDVMQAAVDLAQEQLDRCEIRAPFDAVVTKKLSEQGQWVSPGSGVVEIVTRGKIDAVIDVPESYVKYIRTAPRDADVTKDDNVTKVELTIDATGQRVVGHAVAVNPDGSNAARTYAMKVQIDDRDGLFKVGMSVSAMVPLEQEREYLVVPRDAVRDAENSRQVWISMVMQGPMPVAVPMDVKVLFGPDEDKKYYAVEPLPKMEGVSLDEGMQVVTQGAERLWPMRPLIVTPGVGGGGVMPGLAGKPGGSGPPGAAGGGGPPAGGGVAAKAEVEAEAESGAATPPSEADPVNAGPTNTETGGG